MANEEYSLKEHEYIQTDGGVVGEEGENSGKERYEEDAVSNSKDNGLENGENMKEKNEGGTKILNVGYLLMEVGYNLTDAVVGGEDESSGIDNSEDNNQENVKIMEEKNEGGAAGVHIDHEGSIMDKDAIGNNEDSDQENGQNKEEKSGGTAGVDKDDKRDTLGKDEYEGNEEEEENIENLEAITNQATKNSMEGKTKRKADGNSEAMGDFKQVLKKVPSESNGKECCGNLASKDDNDQDSKGTETGNVVSTCDDDGSSEKVISGGEAKMSPEKMDSEGRDSPDQVDSRGMIFMCNSETKKDCYRYNILGLPANKREMVEKVYTGMKLF
ncbi:uncharacterized protein LOC132605684 [Lycium barbarum]|uniref:uncharacterized protein LOC132605684 n=1 Tax=Lycium barbarum TaxID=112863 RepID=UPI00293EE05C|nr:uncharacterized protein LOC132605684 [Lycium barbarum]XP_060174860.1 uncharacterized protein LOC132605684 [Lycium barbarum]XP_060174868.1 uncharacterized protein LOC132605684 [Lycium barbarum]